MTPRRINGLRDKKGFTLAEVMTASVILVMVMASVMGAFITTKSICAYSIAELNLQRSVDAMMNKIVKGLKEQGGAAYGLRSAVSFYPLPVVNPAGSEIDYIGTDGNTRRYYLNNNSVIYESPTQSPNTQTIYTAPAGVGLTFFFWEPQSLLDGEAVLDNELVGIYIAITQTVGKKPVSGSASTYVNIRNLPK